VDRVDAQGPGVVERLDLKVGIAEQAIVLEDGLLPRAGIGGRSHSQQQDHRHEREQRLAHELASGGAEGHYFLPYRVRFGYSESEP
jgi:hypothetical protein